MLVPLAAGIGYAFHDITLLDPNSGDYVGLAHFRDLSNDAAFWNALSNTVTWTLGSVSLQFGLGLTLALLLSRAFAGRRLVQMLVFLPWAIPSFSVRPQLGLDVQSGGGPAPALADGAACFIRAGQSAVEPGARAVGPDHCQRLVGYSFLCHYAAGSPAVHPVGNLRSRRHRWRGTVGSISPHYPALSRAHHHDHLDVAHGMDREFCRSHRGHDQGRPRRLHPDSRQLHLHTGLPAFGFRLCLGGGHRAAGAAADVCAVVDVAACLLDQASIECRGAVQAIGCFTTVCWRRSCCLHCFPYFGCSKCP